ncbi:MAG: glutamate synthase subunit alpha, partial [Firmicutes bacterium]|nr:glutamate synthase subunit alpha [Bacillota bacterium]
MRMEDCGGLYRKEFEHDSCGVGALINISGEKTHSTVDGALKIVEKLAHRAGRDAEGKTGDGVGILMQISHDFFSAAAMECGIEPGGEGDYGVGMFFFPQDESECAAERKKFEDAAASEGLKAAGWRTVPVRPEILGNKARSSMPRIMQCFVLRPGNAEKGLDFERRLYTARRVYERAAKGSYVCSCSSRTIVYKGMFLVDELRRFYPDLQSEDMKSAIAMVHSRFSTNTEPSWKRAHPNRFITHNGEINTIRGNEPKMAAREESMRCEAMDSVLDRVYPVVDPTGSDSTKLDNTLEFLVMSGMPLPKAVMICIPEAWRNSGNTGAKQDFYHYWSTVMEAWDGPASILFSDGDIAGAALDRNGLRPSRYYMTSDGQVILSSEVGVLDIEPEKIIKKSRIRPGSMLVVDTVNHRVLENDEIKSLYASEQPYGKWVADEIVRLGDLPAAETLPERVDPEKLACLQKAAGFTWEDITETLIPMAETENAPTAAMGSDIPLAVLDTKDRPLFDYFQQMFAQVTNPPIDTIREEIVTDTYVYAGRSGNLLEEAAENCRVLEIPSPILSDAELSRIKALDMPGLKSAVIPALFKAGTDLGAALENMFAEAEKAMNGGADILI